MSQMMSSRCYGPAFCFHVKWKTRLDSQKYVLDALKEVICEYHQSILVVNGSQRCRLMRGVEGGH